MNKKEVDYIILGAGSAGCVLANRLSEDGKNSVAVLEAGPTDINLLEPYNSLMIHIPAGVYNAFKNPSINWNYETEEEKQCLGRKFELPRGKIIGGSSSINSMVYMRGHPYDYDNWSNKYGLSEWSFDQCLPYFKRCESSDRGENEWRGGKGPLGVTKGKLQNPLYDALLQAGDESGQGTSEDLNGFKPQGIARFDSTTKNGFRSSAATAHLKPALKRSNIILYTRAHVNKIIVERNCAIGVEYNHKNSNNILIANKSVILSAGAIKSPQILMLSGIGPADYLKSKDISVIQNLPGVGKNLQDHMNIIMGFECTKDVTLHKLTRPYNKLAVGLRWFWDRGGIAASNIWEMGGQICTNHNIKQPNVQFHFAPIYNEYSGRKLELFQGFQFNIDQLRPKSRGEIKLHSNNPNDKPAVFFNYLSDPYDLQELKQAYKSIMDIVMQPSFNSFRGKRIAPSPDVKSDSEIEAWIRKSASTDYHPSGTCKMGNDGNAVVDQKFKVHGLENLYVVDASIMPEIVSANLNAPIQMLAERASDFILNKKSLEPEKASFHFQN